MVHPSAKVTVVIPTHDRYPKLGALLKSLQSTWSDVMDSVVIVDDSTNQVDLEAEFRDINLRHVHLPSRVFISRAKNIGWRFAKTDLVYFIDDDNVVDGTTVSPVYQKILQSERNGAVMPAVLYKAKPDLVWVYATPFLNSRYKQNLVGRNHPRDATLEGRELRTDALPNASILRREALKDVGGFDERLVVNSSMDIALRLKKRGWRVIAYTGAFIYHDVEPPGEFGWWAGHGAVDPERVRYEIRDWFLLSSGLRRKGRFFVLRAMLESSRFVVPNALAYVMRGNSRRQLLSSMAKGYVEGIVMAT